MPSSTKKISWIFLIILTAFLVALWRFNPFSVKERIYNKISTASRTISAQKPIQPQRSVTAIEGENFVGTLEQEKSQTGGSFLIVVDGDDDLYSTSSKGDLELFATTYPSLKKFLNPGHDVKRYIFIRTKKEFVKPFVEKPFVEKPFVEKSFVKKSNVKKADIENTSKEEKSLSLDPKIVNLLRNGDKYSIRQAASKIRRLSQDQANLYTPALMQICGINPMVNQAFKIIGEAAFPYYESLFENAKPCQLKLMGSNVGNSGSKDVAFIHKLLDKYPNNESFNEGLATSFNINKSLSINSFESRNAVEILLKLSRTDNRIVLHSVVKALGNLGITNDKIVETLIKGVNYEDNFVKNTSLTSIINLSKDFAHFQKDALASELDYHMQSIEGNPVISGKKLKDQFNKALAFLGKAPNGYLEKLTSDLENGDTKAQLNSALTLLGLGKENDKAVHIILDRIASKSHFDNKVRIGVLSLKSNIKPLLKDLISSYKSSNGAMRRKYRALITSNLNGLFKGEENRISHISDYSEKEIRLRKIYQEHKKDLEYIFNNSSGKDKIFAGGIILRIDPEHPEAKNFHINCAAQKRPVIGECRKTLKMIRNIQN